MVVLSVIILFKSKKMLKRVGESTQPFVSDGGSEPVPYAVVKVDCAGGLVIEVLYHSDQVGVDVETLHGGP